ncbi:Epithelium specific ets factor 3, ese3 [Trichuris trichiura]|uniref:Epithelium specific ets factor 3, ese3 n=1 Tax=Trichuris trichiura TaxID=36087 RepID=A0A077Z139_TRITR|nr:Epithelium specific ets factor 3, ese3 [Trichuris trichiura]
MSRGTLSSVRFKTLPNSVRLDLETFRSKKTEDWNVDDLIGFMIYVAGKYRVPFEELNVHKFSGCAGKFMALMSEENFKERDPKYGTLLFREFRNLCSDALPRSADDQREAPCQSSSPESTGTSKTVRLSPKEDERRSSRSATRRSATRTENDGSEGKRGHHKSGNKLWEFIRDTLKNPETCPSIVRWENREEGIFRIVESEKMAQLWGLKKNNSRMTYEKLSRAMRYYYNSKIILPVSGRRLVYKFGPHAVDWKPA